MIFIQREKLLIVLNSSGKNNDEWLNYTGKIHPYQSYSDNSKFIEATFDERDFILIIIIKFLSLHNFQGYTKEIADYLG